MPSPTARRKFEQKRETLLLTAAAVFAEKGFHAASTGDIAQRLDMKQASLYYYYPSKEAILEAVCHFGITESVARLQQIVDAEAPFMEKIRRIIMSNIYNARERCDCLIVFTQQRRYLPDDMRGRIRERSADYRHLLMTLFDHAIAAGDMSPGIDRAMASRILTDLCSSLAEWLRRQPGQDLAGAANQYARLFCCGVKAQDSGS